MLNRLYLSNGLIGSSLKESSITKKYKMYLKKIGNIACATINYWLSKYNLTNVPPVIEVLNKTRE